MEPIKAPWKNILACCLQGYRQPNQASKEDTYWEMQKPHDILGTSRIEEFTQTYEYCYQNLKVIPRLRFIASRDF